MINVYVDLKNNDGTLKATTFLGAVKVPEGESMKSMQDQIQTNFLDRLPVIEQGEKSSEALVKQLAHLSIGALKVLKMPASCIYRVGMTTWILEFRMKSQTEPQKIRVFER